MKFKTNAPPDQLFELLKTTAPFDNVAVMLLADPPEGVTTASTNAPKFTLSGLGFVTLNCSTGTFAALGSCVESGGVPVTVATVKTGGVAVGVAVGVFVGVLVGLFVGLLVGVIVGVFVGVLVGVFDGVFVRVAVGVFVGVWVAVFVGLLDGVLVGVLVSVLVGVFVNVGVGVFVGVLVGEFVGVFVGVCVGVLLGVIVAVAVQTNPETTVKLLTEPVPAVAPFAEHCAIPT